MSANLGGRNQAPRGVAGPVVGLVDADAASRAATRRTLEAARYAVREFEHPDTATDGTALEPIDVFVTGLLFARVRGVEFVRGLRTRAVAGAAGLVTSSTLEEGIER